MEQNPDGQNGLLDQKPISLKALVDKQSKRILFAESDGDFVDVLFSFLTMPMGTIVRNTRERPPAMGIGCMNNLYSSVETFDKQIFRTEACKTMLLYPRNGAATLCKNLKLKILDDEPSRYFLCNLDCTIKHKLLSHYMNAYCACGEPMNRELILSDNEVKRQERDPGVFFKAVKFIVTDELEVMPLSTATSFALLSKLGVRGSGAIEEREFSLEVTEVLDLLKLSLVSRSPLTKVLLKHEVASEPSSKEFGSGSYIEHHKGEHGAEDGQIFVKIFVSKSKKMLCFAEANEDFVSLIFSFLTIPLGYILKQMHGDCPVPKGCIKHLYSAAMDLGAQNCFKSNSQKEILLSPKVAPGFGYANQLLDVEEGPHNNCCYWYYGYYSGNIYNCQEKLSAYNLTYSYGQTYALSVVDPKSPYNDAANSGAGFVKGSAMFVVTDNLNVSPLSTFSTLSILQEKNVDFSELDEQVVHVGKDEAKSLLVASLISETALTDVFLRNESNAFPSVTTSSENQK